MLRAVGLLLGSTACFLLAGCAPADPEGTRGGPESGGQAHEEEASHSHDDQGEHPHEGEEHDHGDHAHDDETEDQGPHAHEGEADDHAAHAHGSGAGPHGGHLFPVDTGEHQAELVHDDKAGKLTVYLLDAAGKNPVPLAEGAITLKLFAAGDFVDYPLAAVPEGATKASQFERTDPTLHEAFDTAQRVRARLLIPIDGKSCVVRIEHHAH